MSATLNPAHSHIIRAMEPYDSLELLLGSDAPMVENIKAAVCSDLETIGAVVREYMCVQ